MRRRPRTSSPLSMRGMGSSELTPVRQTLEMTAQLRVQDILDAADADVGFHVLAGRAGLSNVISIPRVQEPGLALAGFRARESV